MKIYSFLNQLGWLKSYAHKFLIITFLGIHIPLIGVILFILFSPKGSFTNGEIIGIVLALTLVATGITLWVLNQLIKPVSLASEALKKYRESKEIISIPTSYNDEMGQLLKDLRATIHVTDRVIREKEDIIGLISHDIRSSIGTMINLSEVLELDAKDETIKMEAHELQKLGNKTLNILRDTLLLLKTDSIGMSEKSLSPILIHQFINSELKVHQPNIEQKDLRVELLVSPSDEIRCQPEFLQHIIDNLVTNAIKFSHKGGLIRIKGRQEDGQYILSVIDQGLGFDPEVKEHIFNKFTKYGKQGTMGESSSGLGLYLSRLLAEKQGGKIEAHSEGENKGAQFTVFLSA